MSKFDILETAGVEKLKGKVNYEAWKFQVTILLEEKEVLRIATGITAKPSREKADDVDKWLMKDAKARRIITTTVDRSAMIHLYNTTTSNGMWKKLEDIYGKSTGEQKCELLQEFFEMKYEKADGLMAHISKIENVYQKLKMIDPTSINEETLISKVLTTLPEKMQVFRTAWDMTPNEDKIYNTLLSRLIKENNRQSSKSKEEAIPFTASNKGYKNSSKRFNNKSEQSYSGKSKFDKNRRKCKVCGKENHDESACYHRGKDKCQTSGKFNHTSQTCYKNNPKEEKGEKVSFLINNEVGEESWVIDSGSTNHVTNNLNNLTNTENYEEDIGVAKVGSALRIEKIGQVSAHECTIKQVMYAPELRKNLLSVNAIVDNEGIVTFDKHGVTVTRNDKEILRGKREGSGLFTVNLNVNNPERDVFLTQPSKETTNWHRRLAHLGFSNMVKLKDVLNLSEKEIREQTENCDVCMRSKFTKPPLKNEYERAKNPLESLSMDLCGPIDPPTFDDKNYFLTVTDDFSGFTMTELLKSKSDTENSVKQIVTNMEVKWGSKSKKFRLDNGGEFSSENFKEWCKNKGISLCYSPPYRPEFNGVSERKNRTLMDRARAVINESQLDKNMWGEAVLFSTYTANRSPRKNSKKTPYEMWFNRVPNLENIRMFGSTAYAKRVGHLKKLDDRADKYLFVGFAPNGYRLFDPEKCQIKISRDVKIIEKPRVSEKCNEPQFIVMQDADSADRLDATPDDRDTETESESTIVNDESDWEPSDNDLTENDDSINTTPEPVEERRYPLRLRTPNVPFQAGGLMMTQGVKQLSSRDTNVREGHVATSTNQVSPTQYPFSDPTSVNEAMASPEKEQWKKSMLNEYNSFLYNDTWELVDLPKGKNLVKNKWVFKVKRDKNGNPERFKSRLVAKGFSQKEGIDYFETFSPVIRHSTLRFLIALSAKYSFEIHHLDVATAFLNGELKEEIYMTQPEGFVQKGEETKVCRLKRAIYGLKQSARAWNEKLNQSFIGLGFKRSKLEYCVYFKRVNDKIIIIATFVDDLFCFSDGSNLIKETKSELMRQFKMTDLGIASYFLGVNMVTDPKTGDISLDQKQYILKLLKQYGMEDCNPISTPMEVRSKIEQTDEDQEPAEGVPYQNLVGGLMYLTVTSRPDLAFPISFLSQFNKNPTMSNWKDLKRILRYLKGTIDYKLTYKKTNETLYGFVDADWGGDKLDRKSFTGYVLFQGKAPISWQSKKQPTVALSTAEAEYMAMTECSKEIVFMCNIHFEIFNDKIVADLYSDNKSAIDLAHNPILHGRTKHIGIRHHFIRDVVQNGYVKVKHVSTENMVADFLTKPLTKVKHQFCAKHVFTW